jgi:hypothetical protein
MTGRCWIPAPRCGYVGPGVQGHDELGRDETGRYVEPRILIPFCQPGCHQGGIEQFLRREGLHRPVPTTAGVLIGRIGVTCQWLGLPGTGELLIPDWFFAKNAEVLLPLSRDLRTSEGLL